MPPDIREGWAGGIKYDGGSGGDGGSVGRAGTEGCRIPISQSEREHFFDEGGVNESFCDGHPKFGAPKIGTPNPRGTQRFCKTEFGVPKIWDTEFGGEWLSRGD